MRYGIDARLYGPQHTGIGRYTKNLIINIGKIDKKNTYVIFGNKSIKNDLVKFSNFKFVELNTKIYSFKEQIINPIIFAKYKLDLLHIPHFNAPIFYPGKVAITIHDLIKHLSTGTTTTTLPTYIYYFKHLFYRLIVFINLKKAKIILTPSNYWKDYLTEKYNLKKSKIFVTYEAVEKLLTQPPINKNVLKKYNLTQPFIVYTGNLYPHKNVTTLINAVKIFNSQYKQNLQLAIICSRNVFYQTIPNKKYIKTLGFVPDEDLNGLYNQAIALVQPSFIEGFGLTGLEAMSAGLPVISSQATCLPEIYQDAALYFDPNSVSELIKQIKLIMTDKNIVKKLIYKGKLRASQFDWSKTAKKTISAYKTI